MSGVSKAISEELYNKVLEELRISGRQGDVSRKLQAIKSAKEHDISLVAKIYGVSGYQMERTIECESRFNNIQSTAYQNGAREDSWGIAQIHLPSHPEVSRDEALDEEFTIEWMAKNFNNPYVTWYGYSRKYDKCN